MVISEEMLLAVLLREIENQCELVLIAYDKLNQPTQDNSLQQAEQRVTEATINRDKISHTPDHDHFGEWSQALDRAVETLSQARQDWQTMLRQQSLLVSFYIQSLLVATANISKLIWRKSRKRPNESPEEFAEDKKMREKLRASLSIDRDMDDYLFGKRELRNHYEHFDERIVEHLRSSTKLVEGMGAFSSVANIGEENILRFYNPYTNVISFKKDQVDLRALVGEIKWLKEKSKIAQQAQLTERLNRNRKRSKGITENCP